MVVVAQSVELQIVDLAVTGSIPVDHPRYSYAQRIFSTQSTVRSTRRVVLVRADVSVACGAVLG